MTAWGNVAMIDATELAQLRDDLAEARENVVAFCAMWATRYSRDCGHGGTGLHETHYDILEKAGARMTDFTRVAKEDW